MSAVPPSVEQVREYIAAALPCEHLQVEGDGYQYQAVVVSSAFEGKRRVARHQLVYAALGERMKADIHAITMRTLTPEEYAAEQR